MSKKFMVLDTNVLVTDPKAIHKFGTNTVVIPMIVIEELDGLKKRPDNVGQSARQVARELDELRSLGRLDRGVKLPTGGTLKVETDIREPTFKTVKAPVPDHYILQVAITLKEGTDLDVVLVTEDTALRIAADSLGVIAQRYQEIAVEDISFYDDTRTISLDPSDFIELVRYGDVATGEVDGLEVNDYLCAKNSATNNSTVLARYAEYETGGFGLRRVESHDVYGIKGRNREQQFALHALMDPNISLVCLAGKAGTGKTLLALAAGLQLVAEPGYEMYSRLTVARPIVSMGKELGYLPGTLKEKLDPWMAPIYDNVECLFGGRDKTKGYNPFTHLLDRGVVQVEALSYIRGRSLPDQFIIIDECQNLSPHEVKTIITRAGEGTKIVLTGDPYQIDSPYLDQYSNGLTYVIDAFKGQPMFASVTLHKGERSVLAETAASILR